MRKAALVCVVVLAAAGAIIAITYHGPAFTSSLGGALVLAGVPLMVLGRLQLGKAFSLGPKATTLVTHGLYSKIPHPLFVFLDIALLGVVIALRQAWLVGPWLALVAVHAWAARRESRVLERAFGDAHRQYRAKTWW